VRALRKKKPTDEEEEGGAKKRGILRIRKDSILSAILARRKLEI